MHILLLLISELTDLGSWVSPVLSPQNWNFKNIIFDAIILHHKLCFQSMLRRNHGWSLIKLKNIQLKELPDAVRKSAKNVKKNSSTGSFRSKFGHRFLNFFNNFSIEHRRWLLLKYNYFSFNFKFLAFQRKILGIWAITC